MKIAFIIGHTKISKGAYSDYYGIREYDFYKSFEDKIKQIGDVYKHNPYIYGYSKRQRLMAQKTKHYDLVFELHFNAANGQAHGCEALYYYKNKRSKKLCEAFCNYYTQYTGSKNRGARPLMDKSQRGFGFVYSQKPQAIILEPFFGDNKEDCLNFDIRLFLRAIQSTLIHYED